MSYHHHGIGHAIHSHTRTRSLEFMNGGLMTTRENLINCAYTRVRMRAFLMKCQSDCQQFVHVCRRNACNVPLQNNSRAFRHNIVHISLFVLLFTRFKQIALALSIYLSLFYTHSCTADVHSSCAEFKKQTTELLSWDRKKHRAH